MFDQEQNPNWGALHGVIVSEVSRALFGFRLAVDAIRENKRRFLQFISFFHQIPAKHQMVHLS